MHQNFLFLFFHGFNNEFFVLGKKEKGSAITSSWLLFIQISLEYLHFVHLRLDWSHYFNFVNFVKSPQKFENFWSITVNLNINFNLFMQYFLIKKIHFHLWAGPTLLCLQGLGFRMEYSLESLGRAVPIFLKLL